MQVPQYALALAPSKVPTLTQLPGRENSRTAETNKIFPKRPRTCVGWHRDPRVEHTRWMPHSQIQQNQPHFGGGGGYFLFYCPVSATTVGLPRKGELRTPPRCIVAGGHRAMLGAGVGGGVIRWLLLRWLSGLQ